MRLGSETAYFTLEFTALYSLNYSTILQIVTALTYRQSKWHDSKDEVWFLIFATERLYCLYKCSTLWKKCCSNYSERPCNYLPVFEWLFEMTYMRSYMIHINETIRSLIKTLWKWRLWRKEEINLSLLWKRLKCVHCMLQCASEST